MIDWHCHILPGLDDGAADIDESLAMARVLAAAGFTRICCTPHRLRGMYDTDPRAMHDALATLRGRLAGEGVPLELIPGMEYCLDEFFVEDFCADPVTLGASRAVLVETPSNADPMLLKENLFHLLRNGYRPLFAHPERHAFLAPPAQRSGSMFGQIRSWLGEGRGAGDNDGIDGTLLADLLEMGVVFQGNLGSVGGYYGSLVREQEERLRRSGIYTVYGSDGHDSKSLERFVEGALTELEADGILFNEDSIDFIAP